MKQHLKLLLINCCDLCFDSISLSLDVSKVSFENFSNKQLYYLYMLSIYMYIYGLIILMYDENIVYNAIFKIKICAAINPLSRKSIPSDSGDFALYAIRNHDGRVEMTNYICLYWVIFLATIILATLV